MASVPPDDSDAGVAQLPDDVSADDTARAGAPSPDIAPDAAPAEAADAAAGDDAALAPAGTPAPEPEAAPRVNDAMRVLSRMQADLDVLTGGKRAAAYSEVDDAFDHTIRVLGISLPPIRPTDPSGPEPSGIVAAPPATAPEGEPYEQDAMGEAQEESPLGTSLPAAPVQTGISPAGIPQPATPTQTGSPSTSATPAAGAQVGAPSASRPPTPPGTQPPAASPATKVDLWQSGTIIKSQAGLPVSITGLNLTQGDYLTAVKQGLWSRVEGDAKLKKGFKNDKDVAAASAAVQKSVPVSTVDVSSGDEVRRFIKEIAKATATAALGGKRGYGDDFERFFTIGRNSANQLVITSIHVVGGQGAHVMSLIPPGSITIGHYHGSVLVQPPNSGDNSAVRLANISSFVIGNGGDTVWEVGRAKGREVYREIRRGGVPGRWQRYLP